MKARAMTSPAVLQPTDLVIRHTVWVRAPVELVQAALTTPRRLNAWLTHDADLEPKPGGRLWLRWKEHGPHRTCGEHSGAVEFATDHQLVFRWDSHVDHGQTMVAFTLRKVRSGTEVQLQESGFPPMAKAVRAALDHAVGWGETLTLLRGYVEKDAEA